MNISVPKSSAMIEIERLGIPYHEEAQFDIGRLDVSRRIQVRESEHYAPKAQVQQYAVQMGETQFPPIVVTQNDWIVDANTRVGARKLRGDKFTAAIVLEVDAGKGKKVDNLLSALAVTLNQTGGQRLTPAEIKVAARTFIELGWKSDQINRAVGIHSNTIGQIRREMAAEAKFAKVGFTRGGKLQASVVRALGSAEPLALNDVPFKDLTELALDANLNVTEIRELAKAMKDTGSDAGMIDHIAKQREQMADRIRQNNLQGNGRPPASGILRRMLGFVLKYEQNSGALVEKNPAAMKEHLDGVERTTAILKDVAEAQRGMIGE